MLGLTARHRGGNSAANAGLFTAMGGGPGSNNRLQQGALSLTAVIENPNPDP